MNDPLGYISLNYFPRDVLHIRAHGSFGCLCLRIPPVGASAYLFETRSILLLFIAIVVCIV